MQSPSGCSEKCQASLASYSSGSWQRHCLVHGNVDNAALDQLNITPAMICGLTIMKREDKQESTMLAQSVDGSVRASTHGQGGMAVCIQLLFQKGRPSACTCRPALRQHHVTAAPAAAAPHGQGGMAVCIQLLFQKGRQSARTRGPALRELQVLWTTWSSGTCRDRRRCVSSKYAVITSLQFA